jgi:solute carrier family 25 (adenine nucleotide translocator) protein 4/5/6/31
MIASGQVKNYTGVFNCLWRVVREQGAFALWRGNLTDIIRHFLTSAFNSIFKDALSNLFPKFNPETQYLSYFFTDCAASAMFGAASLLFVYPLDFAYIRLCAGDDFASLSACIAKITKENGVAALYSGFWVCAAGMLFYRTAYFLIYSAAADFTARRLTSQPPPVQLLAKYAVAQAAVVAAGLAAYPFQTIRHRLILQAGADAPPYRGALDCLAAVSRREGLAGLFAGAGFGVALAAAGVFSVCLDALGHAAAAAAAGSSGPVAAAAPG